MFSILAALFCILTSNAQAFRFLCIFTSTCYFLFFKIFIYLFLAALDLRCCAWAFSSCGERELLSVAVCGLQ